MDGYGITHLDKYKRFRNTLIVYTSHWQTQPWLRIFPFQKAKRLSIPARPVVRNVAAACSCDLIPTSIREGV